MQDRSYLRVLQVACYFALFLVCGGLCHAQFTTTGTLHGTVTDKTGAVVPQAAITFVNEATGVRTSTQTNEAGSFTVPGVQVGTYSLTVTKEGFQTYVKTGIIVHPAIVTTADAALEVGATSTRLEVVASAAQVQTSTGEVSSEIAEREVATLPLNGRNYASLAALMPGVTNMSPNTALNQGGFLTFNSMSINGMGTGATHYTLDGIWNMNTGNYTQTTITPNPDTIQEVRILQNNYGVQYTLAGANVVMVQTRSGTEKFHGRAFEYLRNDALNARNFFSPRVPSLKQNIFGYTFDGPFYIPGHYNTDKRKTFFFWSQQWVVQHVASTLTGASPTAAMRAGTFTTAITDPLTGQPFPQPVPGTYQIPAERISPDALALMNALVPLPNNPSAGFLNYINLNPQINTQRDDQIKVDHHFSEKIRLMGEYLDEVQTNKNPSVFAFGPGGGGPWTNTTTPIPTHNKLAQLHLTHTLSPAMVNTVSVAMNNYTMGIGVEGVWQRSQVPNFHEVLPYSGRMSERLPQVTFGGGWSQMGIPLIVPVVHGADLELTVSDDWSWMRGKHFVQGGLNLIFGSKKQSTFSQTNGLWNFSGQFTGSAIADYLLGKAASFSQASDQARLYSSYRIVSPYFQDRWKATGRLTLTLGLRLLYEPVPHTTPGSVYMFDPALFNPNQVPTVNDNGTITATPDYNPMNGIIANGVGGVPLSFTDAHRYYWAPSAGFAWDTFGDGKTALRGGYGITYTRTPFSNDCSLNCGNNFPRILSLSLVTPSFPNPTGATVAPAAAPSMVGLDRTNFRSAQIQSYSLSLEREFAGNWFASLAGAGNIIRHEPGMYDRNQPLPMSPYDFNPAINPGNVSRYKFAPYLGYAGLNTMFTNHNAYWNALQVKVRHPVGHNLFVSAAYTWQHGLSQGRGTNLFGSGATTQDIYHPGNNYGNSNVNAPHIVALSAIWTLPWYRTAKGWKGQVLGGWQFADITTVQSGFSLDPGLATATRGLATRPNLVSGSSLEGARTVAQWFNTAAFAAPAAGYFGSAGPGIIRGPGVWNFDIAFYKDFRIGERHAIQFRAELFNVFNHTNFAGVSTAFGAGNFGRVTSARDPRIAEFALRYQF